MNAKDLFGLVLRIFGVVLILRGCSYIMSVVYYLMGIHPAGYTLKQYAAAGVSTLALGLILLRGASQIVRFAYPEKRNDTKDKPPEA